MKRKGFLYILLLLLTVAASARPIKPGRFTFSQPDGTTFTAICRGDEFMKIITTVGGEAIIKDSDGWWNYAYYEPDGKAADSGCKVGLPVSSELLSASRMIPYSTLSARAQAMKTSGAHLHKIPVLTRTASEGGATKYGLVILAQFEDEKFMHSREDFIAMLTQEGYSKGGATGSAKEYFDDQFNGRYLFDFQVSQIVTLSRNMAYYGKNDSYQNDLRPAEMIREACELAHETGTDFSLYDDDDDGYVDNVFVIFAGKDEADDPDKNIDCIWSHSWYITSGASLPELKLDGKIIDQYACTAELMRLPTTYALAGIGTFCHEFAHTLGLPDFYDTDYDENGGWSAALWKYTSLMDGGNMNNDSNTPPFLNAVERELTGLATPEVISKNGTYTLEPIHKSGKCYRLDTDNDDEYYLFECRERDSWDRFIEGNGMLVYHIDKSDKRTWEINAINCRPAHQYVDLIEADGRTDILTDATYWDLMENISGVFFPFGSTNSLTPASTPGLKFWSGKAGDISITDIKRDGSNITFNVTGFAGNTPPEPVNLKIEAFMDAAILNFESDRVYDGEATITWGRSGAEKVTVKVAPYESGKYSYIFEGLTPGNKTYEITIHFESDGVQGASRKTSVMTSRTAPVNWPYIYLGKAAGWSGIFENGTPLALRVYNAGEAEAIEWTFNGNAVTPGGDGYYKALSTGTLRAYVYWKDGSVDILEKAITVNE